VLSGSVILGTDLCHHRAGGLFDRDRTQRGDERADAQQEQPDEGCRRTATGGRVPGQAWSVSGRVHGIVEDTIAGGFRRTGPSMRYR
jgi:hypothetical protein